MVKETKVYTAIREAYYALKNWDETKDNLLLARKIRPFHNRHKGQACVVIGNGPSLKAEDLTRLHELGIPTFACNRIHLIFPQTPWRPTYYFISDAKIVAQYSGDMEGIPEENRFFPKVFRDKIEIQYLLMCLITTGFISFGKQFITQFWGGAGYVDAYYVALITMLPCLIPLIQNVGLNIVQAKSKHQFRTLCLFCIAVVNLGFSWLLVRKYGMIGCTLPTGISYLLGQGIAMNWFYWKKMNIDIPAFWRNIGQMTLPILPLFLISGFVIGLVGIESRLTLLAGIAMYMIFYLLVIWKFVANDFEKGLVSSKLKRNVRRV